MFSLFDKYLVVFLTGLAASYLLTPRIRALATRLGVVDLPNQRRPHKRPTARGGGVAVVVAVHAAYLAGLIFEVDYALVATNFQWWLRFALASSVLVAVGIIDDVRGLKPWIKLGGQILAAVLIWFSGAHFRSILGHPLPLVLDFILVVLWLVAIINAFNLIDGLDGLASGLATISAVGLCGIFFLSPGPGNVVILAGLIGACLGFLRYNFNPASIFLGDSGSMFLGFTLGVVSLQTLTKSTFVLSLTIPLMVLGVPIFDALLAIWRRSVRMWTANTAGGANGNSLGVMQPDLEHLHHRLVQTGLSTRKVATLLCVFNAALVVFGLLLTAFKSHAAGIFLMALLAGVYVLMRHLAHIELRETGTALLIGLRRPTHSSLRALAHPVFDMLWMAGVIAAVMWFVEGERVGFWHTWFLELPVWITPTFSLLALSRTYVVFWPRARLRDVLMLVFWIVLGLIFSLGLAMLIDPARAHQWVLRALLVGGFTHPVLVGSRLVYRCVEELVVWLRRQTEQTAADERILLYGGGVRCQLFLRDRSATTARRPDNRIVVGLIDDEPGLRSQWVYGYAVLGSGRDLPKLVARHRIDAIIITAALNPETRLALERTARDCRVRLNEWRCQEAPVGGVAREVDRAVTGSPNQLLST